MPTSPPAQETVPPLQNRNLSAIHFVDAKRGWVVGDDGTILHTTDGGQRWSPQTSDTEAGLRAVHMQGDGQRGWVVGSGGNSTILHTTDGGQRWSPQTSDTEAGLWAVHMQGDGPRGWVVGGTAQSYTPPMGGSAGVPKLVVPKRG